MPDTAENLDEPHGTMPPVTTDGFSRSADGTLDEDARLVLTLRFEGLSLEQIAERVGSPAEQVSAVIRNSVDQLLDAEPEK